MVVMMRTNTHFSPPHCKTAMSAVIDGTNIGHWVAANSGFLVKIGQYSERAPSHPPHPPAF